MNTRNKLAAVLAAAGMALTTTACGGPGMDGNEGEGGAGGGSTTHQSTSTGSQVNCTGNDANPTNISEVDRMLATTELASIQVIGSAAPQGTGLPTGLPDGLKIFGLPTGPNGQPDPAGKHQPVMLEIPQGVLTSDGQDRYGLMIKCESDVFVWASDGAPLSPDAPGLGGNVEPGGNASMATIYAAPSADYIKAMCFNGKAPMEKDSPYYCK